MITENYMKMCEEDNDLKWDDKSWKPKYGDYLPTQEQLQEMINAYSSYEKINRFYEFVHLDASEYGWNKWCEFVNGASMNELWLAFVMQERYNKVWDGGTWVIKKV